MVVVINGLVVVERRRVVAIQRVRETGEGYGTVVKVCQKLHWSSHKRLCQAIEHLETQKRSRVERGDGYVFVSHLTPKQHVVVANLVGKKCKVSCVLNGVPVEALSDTGAKVYIASKIWLEEYLPSLKDKTN